MVRQDAQSGAIVEHLAQRELVYNTGVVCVLEYAWRYPWLTYRCSVLPRNEMRSRKRMAHL